MDEVTLIKLSQRGDVDAFGELVERYSGKALRTACLITGRRNLAEEVVQEAFIQCYRSIRGLRAPETFAAWFFRVLTRVSWRLAARDKGTLSLEALSNGEKESLLVDESMFVLAEAKEIEQLVQAALRKLSVPLRTTVVLRYYNDLSIQEIAKVLGCREGTVKSRLHNALKQLADELKRLGWEVSSECEAEGKNISLPGKGCEASEASTS